MEKTIAISRHVNGISMDLPMMESVSLENRYLTQIQSLLRTTEANLFPRPDLEPRHHKISASYGGPSDSVTDSFCRRRGPLVATLVETFPILPVTEWLVSYFVW